MAVLNAPYSIPSQACWKPSDGDTPCGACRPDGRAPSARASWRSPSTCCQVTTRSQRRPGGGQSCAVFACRTGCVRASWSQSHVLVRQARCRSSCRKTKTTRRSVRLPTTAMAEFLITMGPGPVPSLDGQVRVVMATGDEQFPWLGV